MLRLIVLAFTIALGNAAPSNLAGRELGSADECEGTPGNKKKCYEGATDYILSLPFGNKRSICSTAEDSHITCSGCLECKHPNDVCKPRAKEGDRTFSSKTTFPYWDERHLKKGEAEGPCCSWCTDQKHKDKAWKKKDAMPGAPARCSWHRFCSGCSECDTH